MKTLIKVQNKMKFIFLLAIAFSFFTCEDENTFLPKVTANFTYTLNQDLGLVTFLNTSENADTYMWNFGDETNSTEINPKKIYENGTYTVTLVAKNTSGASASFTSEITILIPEVATLPITFDGANTKYEPTPFDGTAFSVIENPSLTGANATASKVGKITNSGGAFEGIAFELGAPVNLSTDKSIKMLVWSDKALPVLLKLEQGNAFVEVSENHGGTGWETMYFTFDSAASFSKLTLFIDGPGSTSGDFFIDEITQIATDAIPCLETMLELPMDFDCEGIDYATKIAGNVSFEVIDNPELSGINNTDSKVGKIVNTGQNWENGFFNLDTPIDFSVEQGVRLKLFSNAALPIKLKFEDGTGNPVEADVNHTGSGWEELTFTLNSADSYNDMIIFVDGPGTAAGTFYVDDIQQVAVAPPPPLCTDTTLALPIDFDCSGIDYNAKRVDGGIDFSVIDNPELSGVNNTATKVGAIVNKGANWENLNFTLDTPISFATDKSIKLKLYSTVSVPIKLKVETGGAPVENDQTHGGTGWEELTFTLATAESFSNIIIFIDGPGTTAGTFYIDDIEQVAGNSTIVCTDTTLALPIDFDCAGIDYNAKRVDGGIDFSVIDNPELSGVNNTATKVGAIVNKGANWENLNFTLDTPISFATDKSIKLKLYSTVSVPIKLKVETGGAPVENDQTHGGTGWEELTFTLATAESFSNFIIFIDGPGTTAGTFYIDDIEQVTSTAGGGGGGATGGCTGVFTRAAQFPVNFEGCETFMATNGEVKFGDAITAEVAENPSKSGINTSDFVLKVTKPVGANHWEGVQNAFASDFNSTLTFKVKVYSTKANVRYQFEISNDPNEPSVGNPAPITKTVANANEWTELEITFTGVPPGGHNNFVIKPDDSGSGTVTEGATHYIDDVRLE
ncbi:PKD domain-containing protein [Polaribacter batillariae]|uniref:PKD domain-containing protein n=1 Tax=Polaribacter batillariae TaxID=2808900 RepID=A0ABX7SW51_9FLAO|nr:PKD domain-containing protein [Polaribacter batillariae]QTD38482.1 PKD domain-containing protein [Polaribacter batillariae]